MTNREWLGKMCYADMMNIIIRNSEQCVLSMFGTNVSEDQCGKAQAIINNSDVPLNEICYKCACFWLNKKNK